MKTKGKIEKKDILNGEIVEQLILKGFSVCQIAEKYQVSYVTVYTKFKENVKRGFELKSINDLQDVKSAQLKKCLGYRYEEIEYIVDEKGKKIIKSIREKEIAPDTTAQIFYLVNKSNGEFKSINNNYRQGESNPDDIDTIRQLLKKHD